MRVMIRFLSFVTLASEIFILVAVRGESKFKNLRGKREETSNLIASNNSTSLVAININEIIPDQSHTNYSDRKVVTGKAANHVLDKNDDSFGKNEALIQGVSSSSAHAEDDNSLFRDANLEEASSHFDDNDQPAILYAWTPQIVTTKCTNVEHDTRFGSKGAELLAATDAATAAASDAVSDAVSKGATKAATGVAKVAGAAVESPQPHPPEVFRIERTPGDDRCIPSAELDYLRYVDALWHHYLPNTLQPSPEHYLFYGVNGSTREYEYEFNYFRKNPEAFPRPKFEYTKNLNQIDETIIEHVLEEEGIKTKPKKLRHTWLWWLVILYIFYAQVAVTDEWLVPAIEVIVFKFDIPEDVAGATLLSLGCNGPEMLTNVISVFIQPSDVGVTQVVGTQVFNLCAISAGAIFAANELPLKLKKIPFLRDSIFYMISIFVFGWALEDGQVTLFESGCMFGGCVIYGICVGLTNTIFPPSKEDDDEDGGVIEDEDGGGIQDEDGEDGDDDDLTYDDDDRGALSLQDDHDYEDAASLLEEEILCGQSGPGSGKLSHGMPRSALEFYPRSGTVPLSGRHTSQDGTSTAHADGAARGCGRNTVHVDGRSAAPHRDGRDRDGRPEGRRSGQMNADEKKAMRREAKKIASQYGTTTKEALQMCHDPTTKESDTMQRGKQLQSLHPDHYTGSAFSKDTGPIKYLNIPARVKVVSGNRITDMRSGNFKKTDLKVSQHGWAIDGVLLNLQSTQLEESEKPTNAGWRSKAAHVLLGTVEERGIQDVGKDRVHGQDRRDDGDVNGTRDGRDGKSTKKDGRVEDGYVRNEQSAKSRDKSVRASERAAAAVVEQWEKAITQARTFIDLDEMEPTRSFPSAGVPRSTGEPRPQVRSSHHVIRDYPRTRGATLDGNAPNGRETNTNHCQGRDSLEDRQNIRETTQQQNFFTGSAPPVMGGLRAMDDPFPSPIFHSSATSGTGSCGASPNSGPMVEASPNGKLSASPVTSPGSVSPPSHHLTGIRPKPAHNFHDDIISPHSGSAAATSVNTSANTAGNSKDTNYFPNRRDANNPMINPISPDRMKQPLLLTKTPTEESLALPVPSGYVPPTIDAAGTMGTTMGENVSGNASFPSSSGRCGSPSGSPQGVPQDSDSRSRSPESRPEQLALGASPAGRGSGTRMSIIGPIGNGLKVGLPHPPTSDAFRISENPEYQEKTERENSVGNESVSSRVKKTNSRGTVAQIPAVFSYSSSPSGEGQQSGGQLLGPPQQEQKRKLGRSVCLEEVHVQPNVDEQVMVLGNHTGTVGGVNIAPASTVAAVTTPIGVCKKKKKRRGTFIAYADMIFVKSTLNSDLIILEVRGSFGEKIQIQIEFENREDKEFLIKKNREKNFIPASRLALTQQHPMVDPNSQAALAEAQALVLRKHAELVRAEKMDMLNKLAVSSTQQLVSDQELFMSSGLLPGVQVAPKTSTSPTIGLPNSEIVPGSGVIMIPSSSLVDPSAHHQSVPQSVHNQTTSSNLGITAQKSVPGSGMPRTSSSIPGGNINSTYQAAVGYQTSQVVGSAMDKNTRTHGRLSQQISNVGSPFPRISDNMSLQEQQHLLLQQQLARSNEAVRILTRQNKNMARALEASAQSAPGSVGGSDASVHGILRNAENKIGLTMAEQRSQIMGYSSVGASPKHGAGPTPKYGDRISQVSPESIEELKQYAELVEEQLSRYGSPVVLGTSPSSHRKLEVGAMANLDRNDGDGSGGQSGDKKTTPMNAALGTAAGRAVDRNSRSHQHMLGHAPSFHAHFKDSVESIDVVEESSISGKLVTQSGLQSVESAREIQSGESERRDVGLRSLTPKPRRTLEIDTPEIGTQVGKPIGRWASQMNHNERIEELRELEHTLKELEKLKEIEIKEEMEAAQERAMVLGGGQGAEDGEDDEGEDVLRDMLGKLTADLRDPYAPNYLKLFRVMEFPISALFHKTMDWCNPHFSEKHHLWWCCFICSMAWLGIFSFLMVSVVEDISVDFDIPSGLLGQVVCAAGTSLPNVWASILAAKDGRPNTGIANALGSNVQNIFLALGLPWFLRNIIVYFNHDTSIGVAPGHPIPIWNGTPELIFPDVNFNFVVNACSWMAGTLSVSILVSWYSSFTMNKFLGRIFIYMYLCYVGTLLYQTFVLGKGG